MLPVISIITVILTKDVVATIDGQCVGDYQFKSPFLPGESCEAIYNKNTETRDKPGYYWILSRDYCGMTYTGSSCEGIYNKYPETVNKSGYYRINDSQWTYCDMTENISATIISLQYMYVHTYFQVTNAWFAQQVRSSFTQINVHNSMDICQIHSKLITFIHLYILFICIKVHSN